MARVEIWYTEHKVGGRNRRIEYDVRIRIDGRPRLGVTVQRESFAALLVDALEKYPETQIIKMMEEVDKERAADKE